MVKEYRLLGPPGTGKTSWVVRQIKQASGKYLPRQIYLSSFTRAAAVEIASRSPQNAVDPSQIGTLHALCLRGMDRMPIAESKELIAEWNTLHANEWAIAGYGKPSVDEAPTDLPKGQEMLMQYNLARSCFHQRYPPAIRGFIAAWEKFKQDREAMDFTDLLLNAPDELPNAKVFIVDEAQDLSPLQWQIARRWGEKCDVFVCAGDEDQSIFGFIGADPKSLMTPLPPENIKTLSQSYRIPQAVHSVAERWIKKLGTRRNAKEYRPVTDRKGEVVWSGLSLSESESIAAAAMRDADDGRSVMILATCSYMVHRVTCALRDLGAPFHNPYRREKYEWNPLGKGVTAAKVQSFALAGEAIRKNNRGAAERKDIWGWVQLLRSRGIMRRGLKAECAKAGHGEAMSLVLHGLEREALAAFLGTDLGWFTRSLTSEYKSAGAYAARVLSRCGVGALGSPPSIVVGTMHSVKGAEADVVYLIPDLSYVAAEACVEHGLPAEDAVRRLAYVGMTRTRHKLVLCAPAGRHYFEVL